MRHTSAPAPDRPDVHRAVVVVGDAFDAATVLPEQSIDCVVTSPPYWGLRTYGHEPNETLLEDWSSVSPDPAKCPGYGWYREHGGVLGLEPYPEWYISHLVEIFSALRPALKADASMWINLGDTYFARWSSIRSDGRQGMADSERLRRRTPSGGWRHDKQLLMLPARFAIAMQDTGLILRNDVIWAKQNPAPRPEVDRLRLAHEHFFHFVQRTPGSRPRYYYDVEHAEPGALDVVSAARGESLAGHSATFPSKLVRPRILTCSRPGGTVLDPFCGSGTTLAVALAEKRRAIGVELSERFAGLTAERVASANGGELGACAEHADVLNLQGFAEWWTATPNR